MPPDLHVGDISREATGSVSWRKKSAGGACAVADEEGASPMLATSLPTKTSPDSGATDTHRLSLPTFTGAFRAGGTIASGTSAVKRNNNGITSSGKRSN
jgi:hypothetical protein